MFNKLRNLRRIRFTCRGLPEGFVNQIDCLVGLPFYAILD
jgi:hypothetical protein